jgi:hypothetical protein
MWGGVPVAGTDGQFSFGAPGFRWLSGAPEGQGVARWLQRRVGTTRPEFRLAGGAVDASLGRGKGVFLEEFVGLVEEFAVFGGLADGGDLCWGDGRGAVAEVVSGVGED